MASESTRQRVVWLKRLGSWKLVKNRCITEKQNTQVREESWRGGPPPPLQLAGKGTKRSIL